jgi:hypothetical protein
VQKRYLTRGESADFLTEQGLPTTKNQLQKLATTGGGPEYSIYGNKAVYTPTNLLAWAEAKLTASRKSTSERAA